MDDGTTTLRVTLRNTGGELDHRIVLVAPEWEREHRVKQTVMEMLDGIDLEGGDTIIVETAD
jgi:hypothetical protein